jgi:hypothetical protein
MTIGQVNKKPFKNDHKINALCAILLIPQPDYQMFMDAAKCRTFSRASFKLKGIWTLGFEAIVMN